MIVNADDLGMTPGTNLAIFEGFDKGTITHTSIMANGDYFEEAIEGIRQRETLGLGVHLNLTYGRPLIPNPLYSDKDHIFNLSYLTLLLRKNQDFLLAVENEFEDQIKHVLKACDDHVKLTHLDSHRHVHLIPHIYPIVARLAEKYQIPRVRLINEDFTKSLSLTRRYNFIWNGGIIKYLLLGGFSLFNKQQKDLYQGIKFYSILYTGVIGADILQKLKDSTETYEIMVHPGYPKIDQTVDFYDPKEKQYRLSDDRTNELETVLSLAREDKYLV